MSIKLKIQINNRLKDRINTGLRVAVEQTLNDIKANLSKYTPEEYMDYGKTLSKLLKQSNLEPVSGALMMGWGMMIDSLSIRKYGNSYTFTIFDSNYLQTATPWIGVPIKPVVKRSTKARLTSGYGSNDEPSNLGNLGTPSMSDGTFRPLPTQGGFKWFRNPYPSYGYWLLYEQGVPYSMNSTYEGSHFIRNAYTEILGINANGMLKPIGSGDINFSIGFKTKLERYIVNSVRSYVNGN